MAEMKYILNDLDYYSEVYQTYIRCSGRHGSIQEWVDTAFKEEVVEKLSKRCQSADPLKVLGIGSGAGNIDCAMLEQLLPTFPQITNTILDPSEAQNDRFKKLVNEKEDTLKGASFEWKTETSDQYLDKIFSCEGGAQPPKFHLIHAVHVLYYAADLKQTLKRLHDMLEDGGLLFIIIVSRECTIIKVHENMNEIVTDLRPVLLTDEMIGATLDSQNMPYSGEQVTRYIKGTSVFKEGSQDGDHLLDFLTHSKDFRKTAPDNLRESVLKYLRDPECSMEKDGEILFFRYWVPMSVPK
ncbi:histamine N-methyltransferase [Strongylocentrotus purpuratus]|uniref:Histamine N-methyltransferase n=1 Tax=Strongylocentrotus purpuratus TaxID=7668 RepID=A0A7M7GH64_STRPU|nr:histamine N-methyltransferase [Strongylocentrotus purpuratus]|eukprot:XP_003726977.1 PREDICTED: histamine N-methyltransferase [Strongylocentrotus purpuratus]